MTLSPSLSSPILAGNRIKTLKFTNDSVVLDRHEIATANDTTGMGNTNTDDKKPNEANSNPDEANSNPDEANSNPEEANNNLNEANSNPDENTKDKDNKTNISEHNADDDTLMQLTYLDIQDNPVNSLEGFRAINKDLQYLDVRYQ